MLFKWMLLPTWFTNLCFLILFISRRRFKYRSFWSFEFFFCYTHLEVGQQLQKYLLGINGSDCRHCSFYFLWYYSLWEWGDHDSSYFVLFSLLKIFWLDSSNFSGFIHSLVHNHTWGHNSYGLRHQLVCSLQWSSLLNFLDWSFNSVRYNGSSIWWLLSIKCRHRYRIFYENTLYASKDKRLSNFL